MKELNSERKCLFIPSFQCAYYESEHLLPLYTFRTENLFKIRHNTLLKFQNTQMNTVLHLYFIYYQKTHHFEHPLCYLMSNVCTLIGR